MPVAGYLIKSFDYYRYIIMYLSHFLFFCLEFIQRRRKQSRAGGGGGGGSISKKNTLLYFGKQAEKPNFKKIACLY